MKKIKQAIIVCFTIGTFILITQISCQKTEAQANPNQPTSAANLILLSKWVSFTIGMSTQIDSSSGNPQPITVNGSEFYLINLDGTNERKISINLPPGLIPGSIYGGTNACLTPGGQKLIFEAHTYNSGPTNATLSGSFIYSCSIDGSDLRKVIDIDNSTQLTGTY